MIGDLLEGAEVLRAIAARPVTNTYLIEKKGRAQPGAPSFARPRDVPLERLLVEEVRVLRRG